MQLQGCKLCSYTLDGDGVIDKFSGPRVQLCCDDVIIAISNYYREV